jgi:cytosine/uracil/thiamine/allantoin permease
MAAVPNPFLLPSIVALGLKKASPWRVFLACWAGKSIAYIVMAFVGYFGLHLLGIN